MLQCFFATLYGNLSENCCNFAAIIQTITRDTSEKAFV